MKIIEDIAAWQQLRDQLTTEKKLGFVPTMGALHHGHISLIERAKKESDVVVASIFVNPLQFNEVNDYQNYPNFIDRDIEISRSLNVDYLLMPELGQMKINPSRFTIDSNDDIANQLEGEYRPKHFSGVLTIVMKLFQLIRPDSAYFGEKDYQQACLIKQLVSDFFMPISVVICPTIREASGLPLSSRNSRLTESQRSVAIHSFQLVRHASKNNLPHIIDQLSKFVDVDYLVEQDNRLFVAMRIGDVRLIDNFSLGESVGVN